jgi:hypothetical protein
VGLPKGVFDGKQSISKTSYLHKTRLKLMLQRKVKTILVFMLFSMFLISVKPSFAQSISLQIQPAVSSIPADGRSHPAFFIFLQDASNKPYPLHFPLNVTISCSDERVLEVQKSAVIKAMEYYIIVNATSSVIEKKSVEVTVSASGFTSSKITVVVEPPAGTPQSLVVTIMPDSFLPLTSEKAELVIIVVDAYGKPTKARSDVTVTLSSSNLQVANVELQTVKILKGEFSVATKAITTGFQGSSTISASAPNLKFGSAQINVVGPQAQKIWVWAPPTHIVGEAGYVFIGIVDANGRPVSLVSPLTISLFSSNSSRFSIQSTLNIAAGEWKATATLTCNGLSQATITASAKDLLSGSITLTGDSSGGAPKALRIYSLASSFPADEKTYPALIVQAVDNAGKPTLLSSSKVISIFSSSSTILSTVSSVTINAGKSKADVSATPKILGSVRVTAATSELTAAEVSVSVYAPVPDKITIQSPPIPADGQVRACILTSAGGIPVAMLQDTTIQLSSSNMLVGESDSSVILAKKKFYNYINIIGKFPGQFFLTTTGSGLPTEKTSINVLEIKPSTFIMRYVKPIINYNFPLVVQLISSQGSPAVSYDPVLIDVKSSNLANLVLPSTISINPENTETLVYGRGLVVSQSAVTLTSAGFTSLTENITPVPVNVTVEIQAKGNYKSGDSITIKALVTLDGEPVKRITILWKGNGLVEATSITNEYGLAENTLNVAAAENVVEAGIAVGGAGYLGSKKTILGVPGTYSLVISSNAPVEIPGSGNYAYGEKVLLNAPKTVGMTGIFGVLGGKYQFVGWTGDVTSSINVVLSIEGVDPVIRVNAVYAEDLFMVYVTGGIIGLVLVAAALVAYFKVLKPRLELRVLEEKRGRPV